MIRLHIAIVIGRDKEDDNAYIITQEVCSTADLAAEWMERTVMIMKRRKVFVDSVLRTMLIDPSMCAQTKGTYTVSGTFEQTFDFEFDLELDNPDEAEEAVARVIENLDSAYDSGSVLAESVGRADIRIDATKLQTS
jgi:hypothetical protein